MVKKFVFIAALTAILFAGCNSNELDFDNIEVQPITGTYSFPLGEVSYTMRELISNVGDELQDFQVDEDSLITIVYYDSIEYQSDTDFVQIEDISNSSAVSLGGVPAVAGPGTVDLAESFTFDYEPTGDEIIDSVFYATGDVTVDVTTTLPGTLDYTFTIQNTVTTVNEIPLELNGTVNGPGSNTTVRSLLNHKTLLTETANNTFVTDFAATLTLAAGQNFTGTESLTFDITFGNQTFSIVYGKFGQDTVQVGNETLDIEFFAEMGDQGLFFGNPTLRFNFNNTFGIPLGIDFSGMYGDDGAGGNQTFLSGDLTETIPVVESGDINNPGDPVASTIEINSGNSSIVDLLATSPARLGFDVVAISNPYDVTATNFVTQTNEMDATIEIEIPMEVRLEDMEQSGFLDLGDGLDVSNVDSAFIRVVTINELPFSATLNMEIQDEDSVTIHPITSESLVLNAPFIDVNGFVTDPNGASADIPLSQAGIEALGTGSHIRMVLTLNTPGSLNSRDIFVKILTDYAIEIKVGVGGTVNIDL